MDWDELYSFLIMATGWTWDYIDQYMTLSRLKALSKYWESNPPLHLMVKSLLNIGSKKEPVEEIKDGSELAKAFPNGIKGA